jgi:hypothetical protein
MVKVMEEKLNIVEILKDKPLGTKLYDLLYNVDVELDTINITDTETVVWCTNETDNNTTCHRGYSEFGTVRGCSDGLQILLPSKSMRDWRKFSWKKGDVLISNDGKKEVFFNGFTDDTYALFKAKHGFEVLSDGNTIYLADEDGIATSDYTLETEEAAKTYINTIEERLGGKLNRETLEVEKAQPDFKDGDILSNPSTALPKNHIFIFSKFDKHKDFEHHVALTASGEITIPTSHGIWCRKDSGVKYATEEEKKLLFSALEKEGKAWDAEKKQIVDLKPKVELKPFDKVLVRNDKEDQWSANIFSYQVRDNMYYCLGECYWRYCIPYEGNEHLLGTINSVEGYEENQK